MTGGNDERRFVLRIPAWSAIPGLAHGFLGRADGLPPGPFTIADVKTALVAAGEDPGSVIAARQVHGARVVFADALDRSNDATPSHTLPEGDALASGSAGTFLTIRTADCVPVLIVARERRAAAAVHAGWRGLLAGVLERAIDALGARHGAAPASLLAAIGPAIGPCCYEFGAEHRPTFVERFGARAEEAWRLAGEGTRHPRSDADGSSPPRLFFDLRLTCRIALERHGVPPAAIAVVGPCTADHPVELHSYRRDGANAGRQLSYVGWRA
jgi:YfiH family protein